MESLEAVVVLKKANVTESPSKEFISDSDDESEEEDEEEDEKAPSIPWNTKF